MPDSHANFAYSTVATAPSPATSGASLVVASGQGTLFPATPFNAVICPAGTQPTSANAEIVRVTARSTDTFTITRTQEGTSARTVIVGDQIFAAITKKTLTDIELPDNAYTRYWSSVGVESFGSVLVANQMHVRTVIVQEAFTVTGVQIFNDSVVSGNVLVAMYDILGTTQIGASASTAQTPAFNPQRVPFATPAAITPGAYLLGAMLDNATGKLVVDSYSQNACSIVSPGSFAIPATITPPASTARTGNLASLSTY